MMMAQKGYFMASLAVGTQKQWMAREMSGEWPFCQAVRMSEAHHRRTHNEFLVQLMEEDSKDEG